MVPLVLSAATERTPPAGGKIVKDVKGVCQILVPEDWTVARENSGSAVLQDASKAIAIVTSQPGQAFKPLTAALQKMLGISRERMLENSARRIFYQDKVARDASDTNAFSAMVPGKDGSCSSRVLFAREVPEEGARKIVLSLGAVPQ